MKKLLLFRSELLPYSETFIKEQVLACSRWKPVVLGVRKIPGLSLDGLDVRLIGDFASTWLSKVYWRLIRELEWYPLRTVSRLRTEDAALVHAHFGLEGVAIWPLARRLNLPLVVTLHGADICIRRDWWESGAGGRGMRKYPGRLLALAQQERVHFVAVSEAIKVQAIEYGIPPERITVRYIGIDVSRFRPAGLPIGERPRRIIYVGRMVEKKGGHFLIDAFARVRARIPDAELVMVGGGPLLERFQAQAQRLGVPVTFTGALTAGQVKDQLDGARVFCLPSITAENGDAEGFGLVILEAQACGVPVVTSARGGAAEGLLHGATGFAFKEGDVPVLAESLAQVLQDDDLASRMSREAVTYVTNKFDIRRCTGTLEDLYDEVTQS